MFFVNVVVFRYGGYFVEEGEMIMDEVFKYEFFIFCQNYEMYFKILNRV